MSVSSLYAMLSFVCVYVKVKVYCVKLAYPIYFKAYNPAAKETEDVPYNIRKKFSVAKVCF